MKAKTLTIIAVITLAFALALFAQQQRTTQTQQPAPARPDPKIIAKLSEIVAIRERLFQDYEMMLGAGRAPADGSAEIDLAEARIELARESGQTSARLTELKSLVVAHERRVKRVQGALMDRGTKADVDRASAALLEAEVRLLRAQK